MTAAFDVVIAGAGPAGSATALALARCGLRVGLCEQSRFEHWRVGESLAPSVQPLLRELGVWAQFEEVPQVASFGGLSVWGDDEPRAQSYMAQRFSCGFHVDRRAFDRMLAEAAQAAGADLQLGAALERCECTQEGYRVSVRRGRERSLIHTRVLIDATGRRAHVSRQLGAQRLLFDRAVAVAARCCVPTESHLLVEAAAPGWFYSAPLSDDTLSVMWMTDADLCAGVPLTAALAQAPWTNARLQAPHAPAAPLIAAEALWPRAKGAAPEPRALELRVRAPSAASEPRALVPLTAADGVGAGAYSEVRVFGAHSQRMSQAPAQLVAAGPYLAVGDAALAVDPIAGDGVVRALRSAQRAVSTVLQLIEAPQAQQHELLAAYAAEHDAECTRYLQTRVHYYAAEQRFSTPYWQRRVRVAQQLLAAAEVTPR